jgi:hypothetical protein
VGIGTLDPTRKLHVQGGVRISDGTQGAGKVLTSDADGNATWQTPAGGGGGGGTLDAAYDFGGAGAGRTITADAGAVKVVGTDGFLVTGMHGSGAAVEISGGGSRMFFNPRKSAFRAGNVSGTQWNDSNVGEYSNALGRNNSASGIYSTAIGADLVASGEHANAIGYFSSATGFGATAIGNVVTAQGDGATAVGWYTEAKSFGETAMGIFNTSYTPISATSFQAADRLFTIGNGLSAGNQSDALRMLKNGNTAIGNIDPTTKLDVDGQVRIRGGAPGAGKVLTSDANGLASWQAPGSGTLNAAYNSGGNGAGREIEAGYGAVKVSGTDGIRVNGFFGSGAEIEEFIGSQFFFNPRKAAFRAGYTESNYWYDTHVGIGSVAMGANTFSSGNAAVALGEHSQSSGNASIAIGKGAVSTGETSVAIGMSVISDGQASVAMGWNTDASGRYSTALGAGNKSRSRAEIVVGSYATDYTPSGETSWVTTDRLFVIGNGADESNRSTAMVVLKNGNVGLGFNSPEYKLAVNGDAAKPGGGSWSTLSDARLKTIDGTYEKGLAEINALEPVRFRYSHNNPHHLDSKTEQIGFIAQEVQRIFPEAVTTLDDGYLSFNMHAINVALVNAVKELKSENNQKDLLIQELNRRLTILEEQYSGFSSNSSALNKK